MSKFFSFLIFSGLIILSVTVFCQDYNSADPVDSTDPANELVNRIAPPNGYERMNAEPGGYAEWLRHLPLKAGNPKVRLYNGRLKGNQEAHAAVFDIDIGADDLQQCADAVMRLRAEYFYSKRMYDSIAFNFTSGDRAVYRAWINGYRPKVRGDDVSWIKSAPVDSSYQNFRKYLETVFRYAGSYSLSKELQQVNDFCQIQPGDVIIKGGFPGHAVIVVDVAINKTTGERLFLLAQSFMPAQNIHLLKNENNSELSPWYSCEFEYSLVTPEWSFKKEQLKRFGE